MFLFLLNAHCMGDPKGLPSTHFNPLTLFLIGYLESEEISVVPMLLSKTLLLLSLDVLVLATVHGLPPRLSTSSSCSKAGS